MDVACATLCIMRVQDWMSKTHPNDDVLFVFEKGDSHQDELTCVLRFFNVDLRATKTFAVGEHVKVRGYISFFNLFNRENLAFGERRGLSYLSSRDTFLQPVSLFGPGFGPPVGVPLTVQLGARVEF